MASMTLAAIVTTGGTFNSVHGSPGGGHIELWQVINLLGTPVLALLFLQPVIDDMRAWLNSVRDAGK